MFHDGTNINDQVDTYVSTGYSKVSLVDTLFASLNRCKGFRAINSCSQLYHSPQKAQSALEAIAYLGTASPLAQ